jgi:hypothetical protein
VLLQARTGDADGMRGYRRRMEWIRTTADSHWSIRRLTSYVLIVTDGSYDSRRRSDYRPRIDDRALTMAMMGMRAGVACMHWPIGGAARHVASWCVRRCVRVRCGAHDVAMLRQGKPHCAVARSDVCVRRRAAYHRELCTRVITLHYVSLCAVLCTVRTKEERWR